MVMTFGLMFSCSVIFFIFNDIFDMTQMI